MLANFWEGINSKLAERWSAVAVPALLFWVGGLLAFARAHGGAEGLASRVVWFGSRPDLVQFGLLLVALITVAASGVVMRRLTLPVLRCLEGYWPSWLGPLQHRLVARQASRLGKLEDDWSKLVARLEEGVASPEERRAATRLDSRLRRLPAVQERLMPTRVGNVLRTAESRPMDKYGLDAVKIWTHLWLVLPETAREELTAARASLDNAAAACLWGLLLLVWSPWTLWAVPVGLLVALVAYLVWVPGRAEVFADLVEAAFDLYRLDLYAALRWPAPSDPADERRAGVLLTEYLWRGSDAAVPKFTNPQA